MDMETRTSAGWTALRSLAQRPLGQLTLQELLVVKAPPFAVLSRLQSAPHEAQRAMQTRYPLHLAIEQDADPAVSLALLSQHPEAALAVDSEDGSTALHLACSHGASEQVIRALLEVHPAAAQHADEDGSLPIHLAAEHGLAVDAFIPVHRAYPAGAATADGYGRLPLHVAAQCNAPEAVVATLLLVHRPASIVLDGSGKRAVDYAFGRSGSFRVRAALVAASGSLDDGGGDGGGDDDDDDMRRGEAETVGGEGVLPPSTGRTGARGAGAWFRQALRGRASRARSGSGETTAPAALSPDALSVETRVRSCGGAMRSVCCGSPIGTPLGAPVAAAVACN